MTAPIDLSLPIVSAIVGAVVLLFGKKLFWLCVAAAGFAAGVEVAPHLLQQPTPALQLSIAIVLGFVGALLALFLQKIAVAVFGFIAGGRIAVALLASFAVNHTNPGWLVYIIGGIVGAILLVALFDWALVLFSALLGAQLIVNVMTLPPTGATLLFVALTLIGVVIQLATLRRRRAVVG